MAQFLAEDDSTMTYRTDDGRTVTVAKNGLSPEAAASLRQASAPAPQPDPDTLRRAAADSDPSIRRQLTPDEAKTLLSPDFVDSANPALAAQRVKYSGGELAAMARGEPIQTQPAYYVGTSGVPHRTVTPLAPLSQQDRQQLNMVVRDQPNTTQAVDAQARLDAAAPISPAAPAKIDPSTLRFAPGLASGPVIGGAGDHGSARGLANITRGETELAAAKGAEGIATADILHQGTADQATLDKQTSEQLDANQKATDAAQQDVNNTKIDRSKFWKDMSTGQKVLAGISIALSGVGAALQHQQGNGALDIINDGINRNIQDQIDALNSKKGAVEALKAKGVTIERLAAARGVRLWQEVQTKVQELAARSQDPQAKAQAKILIGEAQQKEADLQARLEDQHMMLQARLGNRPGSQEIAEGENLVDGLAEKAGLRWDPSRESYVPVGNPSSAALGTGSSVTGYLPFTKTGQYLTARKGATVALMKRFSPEAQKSIGDSLFPTGGVGETTESQIAQFNNTRGLMSNGALVKSLASPNAAAGGGQ